MWHHLSPCSSKKANKKSFNCLNSEHTQRNQEQIEQLAKLLNNFKNCYELFNFVAGKIKVELFLPLKSTTVFNKQRVTRISLQLQEKVQYLLDTHTHFDVITPVNVGSLTTKNTINNPVTITILKKGQSQKLTLVSWT